MIVIDVSAAAAIAREGSDGPAMGFLVDRGDKAIAPAFFAIEAAQIAWKYTHVGVIDHEKATAMLRAMLACIDELLDDGPLVQEALTEAIKLDHSVYDMLYFVLARRTASTLLTCDRRLAELCDQNDVECVQLFDL